LAKSKRPIWAVKSPELRAWEKLVGFDLFGGSTVQVLVRDHDEPLGTTFLRPLTVTKEGRAVVVLLSLPDPRTRELTYFCAPWYASVRAFVIDVPPEHLTLVLNHPEIRYMDDKARRAIKATLAEKERKEPWVSQSISSQHSSLEGWRSIFSAERAGLTKPGMPLRQVSFLPPALGPVSK
jgi:hypothetical protein